MTTRQDMSALLVNKCMEDHKGVTWKFGYSCVGLGASRGAKETVILQNNDGVEE